MNRGRGDVIRVVRVDNGFVVLAGSGWNGPVEMFGAETMVARDHRELARLVEEWGAGEAPAPDPDRKRCP